MKRKNYQHSGLALVRGKLKITQADMGLKLGVSTSLVKMVEAKRRSLPFEAVIKLAHLEIELAGRSVAHDPPDK